jgi:hypothetical protein
MVGQDLLPFVAQPPLPLQVFLPAHPLSPDLQPPWPLQEFFPAQSCLPGLESSASWPAAVLTVVLELSVAAWRRTAVPPSIPATAAPARRTFAELFVFIWVGSFYLLFWVVSPGYALPPGNALAGKVLS